MVQTPPPEDPRSVLWKLLKTTIIFGGVIYRAQVTKSV